MSVPRPRPLTVRDVLGAYLILVLGIIALACVYELRWHPVPDSPPPLEPNL